MFPRIAVLGSRLTYWDGGFDLLAALSAALESIWPNSADVTLLLPFDTWVTRARQKLWSMRRAARDLAALRRPRLIAEATVDPQTVLSRFACQAAQGRACAFPNSRSGLADALRQTRAQVLLPALEPLPMSIGVPWVGYVPDFQHRHLPQYFDDQDRAARDYQFSRLLAAASAVIVNSRAAADDIAQLYPNCRCRVFSLPFTPTLHPEALVADPEETQRRYRLSKPYFLISNQFWRHKGHALAFRAFARVRACRWEDVELVCTGNTRDYRFPDYFAQLQALIQDLGLLHSVRILGHVPKRDQMALMRGCLAVVQPTEFEGGPGGGAVFDAAAVGIPAIVSDIPVNRELESEVGVEFFTQGSVDDLADRMLAHRERKSHIQNPEILVSRVLPRRKRLGEQLLGAARYAMESAAA